MVFDKAAQDAVSAVSQGVDRPTCAASKRGRSDVDEPSCAVAVAATHCSAVDQPEEGMVLRKLHKVVQQAPVANRDLSGRERARKHEESDKQLETPRAY